VDNLISLSELKRLLEVGDNTVYIAIVKKEPDMPEPPKPTLPLIWDNRLTQRGVTITTLLPPPGELYWRLVAAKWYDERESAGKHHVFMDLLDENGKRLVGAKVKITWNGGETVVLCEAKPGEPYGANYPMHNLAPAFNAQPIGGVADKVMGMGLGSIEDPNHGIHTSYGFVWQLVRA